MLAFGGLGLGPPADFVPDLPARFAPSAYAADMYVYGGGGGGSGVGGASSGTNGAASSGANGGNGGEATRTSTATSAGTVWIRGGMGGNGGGACKKGGFPPIGRGKTFVEKKSDP